VNITVEEYLDVEAKSQSLGFELRGPICMLPNNLDELSSLEESIHFSSALTLVKLLEEASIPASIMEAEGGDRKYLVQKNVTWYGPVLLFAAAEIAQNPQLVSISLGVIANYLTDYFKGIPIGEQQVELSVVTERLRKTKTTETQSTRKFNYKGNVEGLRILEERILKECNDDSSN